MELNRSKLFISKNASEIESYHSQFEAKGYTVVAHSFLSFSSVEFKVQHEYDVIFFGSPRAVTFFIKSKSILDGVQIACVGSKTAEAVESLGYTVNFVGTKSSEPKLVAEEFKLWMSTFRRQDGVEMRDARVLFPISDRSLKTISSVIDDERKEEVIVYSTTLIGKQIEKCDVYVFSSPSNVEGFLLENSLPQNCQIVAWGKSTETALHSQAASAKFCLSQSSIQDLIELL